jgi:ATP-binding cassette subfamily C protein
MDPAKGQKIISFSEFKLLSSGNFLFFQVIKKLPIIKKRLILRKLVNHFISKYKFALLILIILIINYFVLNIIISFYFKYLLNFSINYSITDNTYYISMIILVLYITINVINVFKNIMINKIFLIFDSLVTTKTFKQILLLPYLFYKNRTSGEVLSRIKDLNIVKNYLVHIFLCIFDLLSIIIFTTMIISINKLLSLIIIFFSSILLILITFINKLKRKTIKQVKTYEDIVNGHLIEAITSVETIKGSHLEKKYVDTFNLKYNALLDRQFKYTKLIETISFIENNVYYILMLF